MSERVCGECVACCTVLAVPALGKNEGVTCEHCITWGGCLIYKNRPASCANYACVWLQGLLDQNDRPDKLGLVINFGNGRDIYKLTGSELFVVQPTKLGSESTDKAVELIRNLSARHYVVVRIGFKRTLFGPDNKYMDEVARMLNDLTTEELTE